MEVIIKGKALQVVTWRDEYVMTTEQVAYFLVVAPENLRVNFFNAQNRFVEGKHFFKVEGDDLKKLRTEIFGLQISPKTRTLYLWTRRGVARHAKMIHSDVAWDIFEMLEDNYFNREIVDDSPAWWDTLPTKPKKQVSDFERGVELKRIASHMRNPELREQLLIQAAILVAGGTFLPSGK